MGWMTLLMLSCSGTDPATLIDELRVVAMVAEPPEVGPGESADFEIYIADPEESGSDVLVWACTNLGEGCLEAYEGGAYLSTEAPTDGRVSVSISTTPILATALTEVELIEATTVWALACEPDECDLINEARTLEPDAAWTESLASQLSNPMEWMTDLPMVGVSLAYRRLTVSGRSTDERHINPVLIPATEEPLNWKKGRDFTLDFTVDGTFSEEARVYNYATDGGFANTDTQLRGDAISLKGTAPDKAGEVEVWVVLNDGLGGAAVWTAIATVQ